MPTTNIPQESRPILEEEPDEYPVIDVVIPDSPEASELRLLLAELFREMWLIVPSTKKGHDGGHYLKAPSTQTRELTDIRYSGSSFKRATVLSVFKEKIVYFYLRTLSQSRKL